MPSGTLTWFDARRRAGSIRLKGSGEQVFVKASSFSDAASEVGAGHAVRFGVAFCDRLGRDVATDLRPAPARAAGGAA